MRAKSFFSPSAEREVNKPCKTKSRPFRDEKRRVTSSLIAKCRIEEGRYLISFPKQTNQRMLRFLYICAFFSHFYFHCEWREGRKERRKSFGDIVSP